MRSWLGKLLCYRRLGGDGPPHGLTLTAWPRPRNGPGQQPLGCGCIGRCRARAHGGTGLGRRHGKCLNELIAALAKLALAKTNASLRFASWEQVSPCITKMNSWHLQGLPPLTRPGRSAVGSHQHVGHAKKKGQNLPSDQVFRGGDDGIRTHDPHVANVMLSQLSYIPTICCAFAQDGILNLAVWFVNKAVMTPQFPREWGWRDGVGRFGWRDARLTAFLGFAMPNDRRGRRCSGPRHPGIGTTCHRSFHAQG